MSVSYGSLSLVYLTSLMCIPSTRSFFFSRIPGEVYVGRGGRDHRQRGVRHGRRQGRRKVTEIIEELVD